MNAAELNKILEKEIRRVRTRGNKRQDSIAIQKIAATMIGAARLELQFARQSGAVAHSPYYKANGHAQRALPVSRKRR